MEAASLSQARASAVQGKTLRETNDFDVKPTYRRKQCRVYLPLTALLTASLYAILTVLTTGQEQQAQFRQNTNKRPLPPW